MIRDRLKSVARKAAIKVLKMEFDTQERDPNAKTVGRAGEIDESVIPKIVDGDGDTPGPKHLYDIGRTWVSAQLVSGVGPIFVDMRPPAEVAAGMLPGAILMPAESIKQNLDRLPAKDVRVTVYDQTGELGSAELAAWLREAGWSMARRLQGGYAEWIEHDEPVAVPQAVKGARAKVGDPVRLADGTNGWIQEVRTDGGPSYLVWLESGESAGPVPESELQL